MKTTGLTWGQARNLLESGLFKYATFTRSRNYVLYVRDGKGYEQARNCKPKIDMSWSVTMEHWRFDVLNALENPQDFEAYQ